MFGGQKYIARERLRCATFDADDRVLMGFSSEMDTDIYILIAMLLKFSVFNFFVHLQYDHLSTTIEDYAELAVGFGYTALFVAALPIAALFYLIYSVLQIKGDAWKLLHLYRRPLPRGCEDIGTWLVNRAPEHINIVSLSASVIFTLATWQLPLWLELRIFE